MTAGGSTDVALRTGFDWWQTPASKVVFNILLLAKLPGAMTAIHLSSQNESFAAYNAFNPKMLGVEYALCRN